MNDAAAQAEITSGCFYDDLPRIPVFDHLTDVSRFAAMPQDWIVGVADIVNSTGEVAAGRYKTVNMVGAAVISAVMNALDHRAFPFIFGGDGAGFAVWPGARDAAEQALSAVRVWAKVEFDIELRAALVPVSSITGAGYRIDVARYQASEGADYAMFSGGGLTWAEAQMKAGQFWVPAAPRGTLPDLTGLSCRWSNMPALNGAIVSVVVEATRIPPGPDFAGLTDRIIELVGRLDRGGHPVPVDGAKTRFPPRHVISLEAQASHNNGSITRRKLQLWYESLLAWFFLRTRIPIAGFDPTHYTKMVGRNADFRKFDDGLKMTLDCDPQTLDQLRDMLEQAREQGIVLFGLFQQTDAMMTCIVPSIHQDDHVHFIDGAQGGYARAAAQIKAEG